jgi:hypothetical protein
MLVAIYRYAARRRARTLTVIDSASTDNAQSSLSPLGAVAAVALYGPVVAFAGRTLSESFSTALAAIALCWLEDERVDQRRAAGAGALLGLAVVARYGSAVFVVATLLWLLATRRFRTALSVCLGGVPIALALGALDWLTWGKPFHSLVAYLSFNVFSGKAAAQFGAESAAYYLPVLLVFAPFWVWPGLFAVVRRERPRFNLLVFVALAYAAVITATAHKEQRFLYPALVLLVIAAAPATLSLLARLRPDLRAGLTSLMLFVSAAPLFFDSELVPQRPDQFRAIVKATRDDAATGLVLVGDGLWGAGGYFYIGKNIPWFPCDFAHDPRFRSAMANPIYNRAVIYDGRTLAELKAAGFSVVEQIGRATVLAR